MGWVTHEDAYDVMGGEEYADFLGYTIRIHGERSFTEDIPTGPSTYDYRYDETYYPSETVEFFETFELTGTVVGEIYEPRTVYDLLGVRTVHDYGVIVRTADGETIRLTDDEIGDMAVEYLLPQAV